MPGLRETKRGGGGDINVVPSLIRAKRDARRKKWERKKKKIDYAENEKTYRVVSSYYGHPILRHSECINLVGGGTAATSILMPVVSKQNRRSNTPPQNSTYRLVYFIFLCLV